MSCSCRGLGCHGLPRQVLVQGGAVAAVASPWRTRTRSWYSAPTQFCLMRKFHQHLQSFKSEGSQLFSRTFSPKLQLLPLRRSRGHCLAPYKVIMRWSVAHGSSGNARVWNRERRRRNRQQMWVWSDNRLDATPRHRVRCRLCASLTSEMVARSCREPSGPESGPMMRVHSATISEQCWVLTNVLYAIIYGCFNQALT